MLVPMTGDRDHVLLLGTKGGPAIRPGSASPTSSLLALAGRRIVVDCGLGVTRALVDQGMPLAEIERVFVTHLHSDHYLELGPLLHTAWTAGLAHRVTVHGPAGLDVHWRHFLASMAADIELRVADEGRPELRDLVAFETLDEGVVPLGEGEARGRPALEVRALRNLHPPLVDTFALSFRAAGGHVAFSGDTAFMPRLAEFVEGADLLVHEAMLEAAIDALCARVGNGDERLREHLLRAHTRAADAGRIATLGGVRALALHHLIPADDPAWTEAHWRDALAATWSGELHVGRDGMRIDIGR